MKRFLNGCYSKNRLITCLTVSLLCSTNAKAELYGILESDGKKFIVANVTESSSTQSPFSELPPSNSRRWVFGWNNLQPAFRSERLECRNPDRPVNCLKNKSHLPLCSSFQNVEGDFVKLSLTKSAYGETPKERGISWDNNQPHSSKNVQSAVSTTIAVVGLSPVIAIASPFMLLGAIMNPECAGWSTKWVEFDHDYFDEKLHEALASANLSTSDARTVVSNHVYEFISNRDKINRDNFEKLTNEINVVLNKSENYKKLYNTRSRNFTFGGYPQNEIHVKKWSPHSDEIPVLEDYQALFDQTSNNINLHYANQRESGLAEAESYVQSAREAALRVSQHRFSTSVTSQEMLALKTDIENYGDLGDLLPQINEKIQTLQIAEEKQRLAAEQLRLAEEQRQAEQERKDELIRKEQRKKSDLALNIFRKKIKIGTETNCGPVIEIRSPMIKIAFTLPQYGAERWIRLSTVWPPNYGCRLLNGVYVPPEY